MEATRRTGVGATAVDFESKIFLNYYAEIDFFLSPEGILKVLSVISCIVSAVLFPSSDWCAGAGAGALAAGAATSALACAAACALLAAGVAFAAPLYAPQAWLYTDIIVSSVMGVLLLVTGLLSMSICDMSSALDYLHGPLAIVNAGLVTASAVLTYVAAMRAWDAAAAPRPTSAPAYAHAHAEQEA